VEFFALQHFGDYKMRKTQVALAALALVASTAAMADGVTMYGNIDAGYYSISDTSSRGEASNGLSQRGFAGAGGTAPNFWGIKGSEDLGGGLTASFNLEGQFSSTNGRTNNAGGQFGDNGGYALAPNGEMFGRAANVSLAGDFGKVTLGQQIDPAFLALALTDPRGVKMSFSGLFTWFPNAGVAGGLAQGIFDSGMVSYTSNDINGFSAQVGVSRPGTYNATSANTSSKSNNLSSGHIKYIANGWTFAAGMLDAKAADGTDAVKATVFGAAYSMGALTPKGYHVSYKTPTTTTRQLGIGATYDLGDGWSMDGGFYDASQKEDGTVSSKMTVLGIERALSKRTALYAHIAKMSTGAGADATVGLMLAGNGAGQGPGAGASATGFGLGMRHSF
jgi:predicted porin